MNCALIIAGPCSAETEQQVISTAKALASVGVRYFRAGLWKPRTQPGSFEGVGEIGLQWLRRVKIETGMAVGTEIANAEHARLAVAAGLDFVWIGARTTTNPFAVQEIADALNGNREILVLIKNPMNPDLNLWIGAIKRFQQAGVQRIIAVHRGFSTYNSQFSTLNSQFIYRNDPQWYLPIELKRQMPKLPLICDPSHIAGNRDLVAGLCQKAFDLDFDGLMIESHCLPDEAWSDAAQQLTPEQLKLVLEGLIVHNRVDRNNELAGLRSQIDSLDTMLIETLAKRMQVSKEIGEYKRQNNMPIVQTGRYNDVIQNRLELAEQLGLSEQLVKQIYQLIHEESVNIQLKK
jgi:chorismate mutase